MSTVQPAPVQASVATPAALVPPTPATLAEAGLTPEVVIDLLLKVLYVQGARSGRQLTETLCLPFDLVDEQLLWMQERRFIEVRRTFGPARGNYVFDLAGAGRDRARDALEASQYVGAAPVPLEQYRGWIQRQSVRDVHVGRERLTEAFRHLVIDPRFLEQLGPAVNSSASIFLYGDPGNGKTVIAETIAGMLGGDLFIPHAVDIDGHVMILFDPVHHRPVDVGTGEAQRGWMPQVEDWDRRFVRIRRPVIFVGGELTLAQLDLQYDEYTKTYQAPFQLKAAGGVLVIDDFGRQLVAPRDLLNRWIVPLEKRVDFMALHTGVKFPVPFDCLLIFATNLNPQDLVDEAFLRRIQYKVHVGDPDFAAYAAIFRMECERRGIAHDEHAVRHLFDKRYSLGGRPPRCCHPRDILDHLVHIARYEERPAELSDELLDRACASYFIVLDNAGTHAEPTA
jgi:hypothetical protein